MDGLYRVADRQCNKSHMLDCFAATVASLLALGESVLPSRITGH